MKTDVSQTHESRRIARCAAGLAAALLTQAAQAQFVPPEPDRTGSGKLLLTGGVSQVEGAAGGGLVPWAVISGYDTGNQWGGNVHATRVRTQDFNLDTYGVAVGVNDRLELTLARQIFDTRAAGAELGLGQNFKFEQDIVGAKLRVVGDAVLDSDTWMPQVSVGFQHKQNQQGDIVRAVGARSASGTDFYISATKLFLAQSILVNGTVRMTRANQFGLLGFGGPNGNSYKPQAELSAAYLFRKDLAAGAEFRTKPDNLAFAREQNAKDVFVAWAPNKHMSLTAAYVDLGDIATFRNQRGWYLSGQAGF